MSNTLKVSLQYEIHMDLRQLRYFMAVAESGHITRAAAALGLQQPPLSQQIKALEQSLGLQLFQRHAKGVTLTEAGRLLRDDGHRLLQAMDATESRLRALARGEQGRLALGYTSSAAAHAFVPRSLRACRQQHPQISLVLSEHNAAELTDELLAGRLHCGLLRVPVARPAGLMFETLLSEPAMVALPSDHPLAPPPGRRPRPLALADLRDEGFILVRQPGAPGLYANLLALCQAQGFQPRVVAEVPRMMSNLNLVAAGAGISVVPASMQGVHAHAVAYCPLDPRTPLDAPLTLAWRASDQAGPTATFVALARAMAAPLAPQAAVAGARRGAARPAAGTDRP